MEGITHTEKTLVADAMVKYGGSFVKALGEALLYADKYNVIKIKNTWPEYWKQYECWKIK